MTPSIRHTLALAALITSLAALSGCSESATPQATGKSNMRGLNAVADAPGLNFLIEERTLDTIDYKRATSFTTFDDLSYNFNFDFLPPQSATRSRLATQFIDVQAEVEYTIALIGNFDNPSTIFWEDPVRQWEGTETVFEAVFVHLGPQIGDLDVYFAPVGTVPTAGQALGTATFGQRLALQEFDDNTGGYELILTRPGDPADVVYQSVPTGSVPQNRITYAIFDADPTVPGNVGVNLISAIGTSSRIADVNFSSQARTYHGAFGTANFDGYLESNFANLVYPNVAFRGLSAYADIADGQTLLTATQVGNTGAIIHEQQIGIVAASRNTLVFAGEPGALGFLVLPNNARPVAAFPQMRLLNVAFNIDLLDVYVTDPGTNLEDVFPRFLGLSPLVTSNFVNASEGMRELTVTQRGEKTPVATPIIVDLANGDLLDLIIVDTADPNVLELIAYEFLPAP